MSKGAMGLGILFVVTAGILLVVPDMIGSATDWGSRVGQYLAGAIRVAFGLTLAVSAPATRYPKALRICGIVLVLAGVGVAFVSNDWWAGLVQFWLVDNMLAFRVAGVVAGTLLGAFLIWASRPSAPAV